VGIAIDTYHVWWDDLIWRLIESAGAEDRIACFQAADWITPLPEGVLLGRGLPGSGCVETRRFADAVTKAGYTGPIEIEVFNAALWGRPGPDILRDTIQSYVDFVAPKM
jgi:sugar phosphate isomerase/epimerase